MKILSACWAEQRRRRTLAGYVNARPPSPVCRATGAGARPSAFLATSCSHSGRARPSGRQGDLGADWLDRLNEPCWVSLCYSGEEHAMSEDRSEKKSNV